MGRKKHARSVEESSEEFEIDTKKVKEISGNVWKKMQNPYFLAILLLLVAIYIGIFYRMAPLELPATQNWAESSIQNNLRAQIANQVRSQYPNLPPENLERQVDEQVRQYIAANEQAYWQQVDQTSEHFKDRFKDEDGYTYLLAIDPYYYLRLTENYIENGHPGEFLDDQGRPASRYSLAPTVKTTTGNFHPWLQAQLFKISTVFSSVSLDDYTTRDVAHVAFFVPVIIIALAIIPAFFIGRMFAGNIGGFFTAIFFALHQSLLTRTPAGFSDTDAYNVLFPLLIMLLIMLAMRKQKLWKTGVFALAAGIIMGIFSWAWSGWWYIFDFVVIALIGYGIFAAINWIVLQYKEHDELRLRFWRDPHISTYLMTSVSFLVASAISVTVFSSWKIFLGAPLNALGFTSIKQAAHANLWPNVFTTVAELNAGPIPTIIGNLGGFFGNSTIFFAASFIGITALLWPRTWNRKYRLYAVGTTLWYLFFTWLGLQKGIPSLGAISEDMVFFLILLIPIGVGLLIRIVEENHDYYPLYMVLLGIWMVGTTYASTQGIRFTLLMAPPFVTGLGILIGKLVAQVSGLGERYLGIRSSIGSVILFVLALGLLIQPIARAEQIALQEIPSMNDAWYDTLTKIRNESQPDAIISSWWDFGHQFITIAKRGATSDGGHQNSPQAHWLGRLLLTDSEEESVGILRMLNCDANMAFNKVMQITQDPVESKMIINSLLGIGRDEAEEVLLEQGISAENVQDILQSTHCDPPESFLITSEDMVSKAGVWAHFGSWDFERAAVWNTVRRGSQQEALEAIERHLGRTGNDALQLYYTLSDYNQDQGNSWIAGWPSFVSRKGTCGENPDGPEMWECSNGIIYNATSGQAYVNAQGGFVPAGRTVYYQRQNTSTPFVQSVSQFQEAEQSVGVTVWRDGDDIFTVASQNPLAESVFSKLFFVEGGDTRYFSRFSDVRDVTGQRIIVWQVDWEAYFADLE